MRRPKKQESLQTEEPRESDALAALQDEAGAQKAGALKSAARVTALSTEVAGAEFLSAIRAGTVGIDRELGAEPESCPQE